MYVYIYLHVYAFLYFNIATVHSEIESLNSFYYPWKNKDSSLLLFLIHEKWTETKSILFDS